MRSDERNAIESVLGYAKRQGIGNSLRGGPVRDDNAEPEGIVDNPSDLVRLSASTDILVRDIAAILTARFPGFRWAIQPNEFGKVLNIFCLDFHSAWGYRIRYDDVQDDPKRREAIRAARTILDRFRYPGSRYDVALMALIKRNIKGEAIPDLSGMKATRFTRNAEIDWKLATGKARIIGTKDGRRVVEVKA
jgi:hypothetical protein